MKIILSLFFFSITLTNAAYASVYTFFDKVESLSTGGYLASISIDWDSYDDTPNPCYRISSTIDCRIYAEISSGDRYLQYAFSTKDEGCFRTTEYIGRMMSCLSVANIESVSTTRSYNFSSKPATLEVFLAENYANTYSDACLRLSYVQVGISSGRTTIPGLICGLAPPPIGVCTASDSVELNHGAINSKDIDNNITTSSLNITCNQNMTMNISLSGLIDGKIKLSDNLYSSVDIGNKQLTNIGQEVSVPAGTSSFSIKSTLSSSGTVKGGSYTGSAILILSVI